MTPIRRRWRSPGTPSAWCAGIPPRSVESVTVAVDATAAVVDDVPDRGLLLAHHPLLLRGVDSVAASTPKGALVHRLIRTGRALFTAHTNADSAAPGVSDALADALGLTVVDVLDPAAGADLDKWVIYVPPRERRGGADRRLRRGRRARSATTPAAAGVSPAPGSSCRTTAPPRRSAGSAPWSGWPRTASR